MWLNDNLLHLTEIEQNNPSTTNRLTHPADLGQKQKLRVTKSKLFDSFIIFINDLFNLLQNYVRKWFSLFFQSPKLGDT